ncbi:DUF2185 domain-containing protein [Mycobacteroides abscessus]|uniref:DUF2185 domain-containing protein n=1 Tax=Mycobacteroides abscessus TaxID=36809 RepID=UPI0009A60035|nr:DUF2185 domain-containing protein [Mycobacteroides abscessus]RIT48804.1 DUF2185 domain-containing protein [Mycobacteroides abscessus]SKT87861.1 Protein of uncharacterised function (DUF2185) [Mycobacteroides abscessus subsp. massiliense]SKU07614.1 Protein of uncharacterised function (DUF2185) [Mycobacteroides abscessus subsp. massiliense]
MAEYIEFIPKSGACLATKNVVERRAPVRWMVRVPSTGGADNGWQIMSSIDTSEYLQDKNNWQIVAFNDVCNIEPALIGIYDFPVGSDLQIVRDERGIHIVDTPTGREIPHEEFYVPPQFRG